VTVEILVQDTEPTDVATGTYLYNTKLIYARPQMSIVTEKYVSITGKPGSKYKGVKNPQMKITLLITETGTTDLNTATLGLVDSDTIRKAAEGYDGSNAGLLVWIRDTEGDYFIRHWKGGRISGRITWKRVDGIPSKIGSAVYMVSFTLDLVYTSDAWHSLVRF